MAFSKSHEREEFYNPSYIPMDNKSVKSTTGDSASSLASKVDSLGIKILSSLFNAFPTASNTFKSSDEDKLHIAKVAERLARARPISDCADDDTLCALARTLISMVTGDEWLWKHIQTSEFDGTWVAIICGFYQRLYLHHTEIIEKHCFSNLHCNNPLLSEGKLMVLLFRLQHQQKFQYVVTQQVLEQSSTYDDEDRKKIHIMEMLGNEAFLISNLLESLLQTMDNIQHWAKQQHGFEVKGTNDEFPIKHGSNLVNIQLLKGLLASILIHLLDYGKGLQDDKWLWKHFHNLDRPFNILDYNSWSTIICSLYQGLYLYHTDSVINHFLSTANMNHSILAKERLTVLLFRSQHLQNFQSIMEENLESCELFHTPTNPKFLLMSHLLKSLQETTNIIQGWVTNMAKESNKCQVASEVSKDHASTSEVSKDDASTFEVSKEDASTSEVSKEDASLHDKINAHSGIEFISGKEANSKEDLKQNDLVVETGGINTRRPTSLQLMIQGLPRDCNDGQNQVQNVFLGSNLLPNGWKVEDLIDLKFVHTLGGLICTVIGNPSKSEGVECCSWCIVRHDKTGLLFCVDLKEDAYQNKHHILDGTLIVDYEGILEVATMDGKTSMKSLQDDGSYYFGELEDFVDGRVKKAHRSCAAKALHILPGSDILRESSLKCSALHLLALAFSVGNKENLMFNWAGDSGHIEYFNPKKDYLHQYEDPINCALQKCNILYTHEGTLISEDITWKRDGTMVPLFRPPRPEWPERSLVPEMSLVPERTLRSEGENSERSNLPIPNEDNDKITIILQHQESWNSHNCSTQHLHIDFNQVQASLKKSRAISQGDVVPEVATVLAALKRNGGGGFGAFGWKLEGHLEWRPPEAEYLLKGFLYERIMKEYLKTTVVVHEELHHNKFNTLQVQLKNGTIAEHPEEFFIIRTSGSCRMQVYLYISEPETFVWLTDIVVANARTIKRIFKENLKGKSLTILRSNSMMTMKPKIQPESFSLLHQFHRVQQKFQKQQKIVTEETMISRRLALEGFPPSEDRWNLIVGQQKEYNNKDYYLKATEMQGITCAATHYTTGGALLRTKMQIQPTTSSNPSIHALYHGSCIRVCTLQFHIEEPNVKVTGKFSTLKGISNSSVVYWG